MLKTVFDTEESCYFINHNETPLLNAAGNGSFEIVIHLIENGADVNSKGRFR